METLEKSIGNDIWFSALFHHSSENVSNFAQKLSNFSNFSNLAALLGFVPELAKSSTMSLDVRSFTIIKKSFFNLNINFLVCFSMHFHSFTVSRRGRETFGSVFLCANTKLRQHKKAHRKNMKKMDWKSHTRNVYTHAAPISRDACHRAFVLLLPAQVICCRCLDGKFLEMYLRWCKKRRIVKQQQQQKKPATTTEKHTKLYKNGVTGNSV